MFAPFCEEKRYNDFFKIITLILILSTLPMPEWGYRHI